MKLTPKVLYADFLAQRLPDNLWVHEAHLSVCWMALQHLPIDGALALLRNAIREHNEAVGTINSATSGYHETLTEYYVRAVDAVGATNPEELPLASSCSRSAPSEYWSRRVLFSRKARRQWVDPDLAPLPF